MKDFVKNYWNILVLEFLVLLIFVLFYGRFGDLMVDSFREVYIPLQMLDGKALYKDLFVIYPPLAYLINAFLLKIFGAKLGVFYGAGLITTLGILFFTNNISEKLLNNKTYSFAISLFVIAGLVLSPNVFNAFLPYSYGILYGILFVLIAVYFALAKNFSLMYLFYSFAILCKYEFVLLFPVLIFLSKNIDWKKNLLSFLLPISLVFGILVFQGVRFDDIYSTASIIDIMSGSKTLYWFYSVMGLTFRVELIPIYFINMAKFLCPIYWVQYQEIILWILPIIMLVGILKFKSLNFNEKWFIIATLLISAKVFFALTLQSYGVYFLPFALIAMFIVIPQKFRKVFCVLLIIWSFIVGGFNIKTLLHKDMQLDKITQYVRENTRSTDRVVVYPEGLSINVLVDRKSDNKFYSLIPLYVETFGEDVIIKRLELVKPEYIVVSDYNTSAYYYREFGVDYGQSILKFIKDNYRLETIIKDRWNFKVYKHI